MRTIGLILVLAVAAACDPAMGDPEPDRAGLAIEVNEALAVAHLKCLLGAQTQARALAVIDVDRDGTGEYAFVRELSGLTPTRTPGAGLKIPLLGNDFKSVGAHGYVEVHGYCFRAFLPGQGADAVGEGPAKAGDVEVEGAERWWVAYAWPAKYGTSGRRTFVMDSLGRLRSAEVPRYSGASSPDALDAYVEGGTFGDEFAAAWLKSQIR